MLKMAAAGIVVIVLSSCVVHERRGMPPGHAKRVYIYEDRGHHHHRGHGHRHGHHR